MIGTIRKHTGWLWAVIITATIVSFIYWGAGANRNNNGGGSGVNLGSVYGKKVTKDAYLAAKRDYFLSFFFHNGTWPENDASITSKEIDQQTYLSLLLTEKARQLGINISPDAIATGASERLAALGRKGQVITLEELVNQALAPKGFTEVDFENFIRHELMIEELIRTVGLSGDLITPQEATAAYQLENEQLVVQAVFFNASNYLGAVRVTPAAVGQFYTNYQAEYRLPDQVQINYVAFTMSNYLAQSRTEWAQTNMNFKETVEHYLSKEGDNFEGATNKDEARAKITQLLIEERAAEDAKKDASDFAGAVFNLDPVKPENLATVAAQKGLIVHHTVPFTKDAGTALFDSASAVTKAAFELTDDSPLAGPLAEGSDSYVIALAKTLPSYILSFDQIRARVTVDYENRESTMIAQESGAAFYQSLTNKLAAGKSFATACVLSGQSPLTLPAFSTSTQSLPELGEQATLGQIKEAAFTTGVGRASGFQPTATGGFVIFVQSKIPVDQSKLVADLPEYTKNLRRARQNEAFNEWLQNEAAGALQMPQ